MIRLGTSGWRYEDWRGPFYPQDLPQRLWLEHFATRFATVEINNSFYRLPERATFTKWANRVNPGFCFAVKVSRYLTHVRRLKSPGEAVSRFAGRAEALGAHLGPVLLQLPPTLRAELLDGVLRCFSSTIRVAVEPRHESWWTPEIRAVLEKRSACLVWADRNGRPVTPLWRTTDWGYLRLHQGAAQPHPRYGRTALRSWLERIAETYPPLDRHDVFVYFNNDPGAAAIHDASAFGRGAERRGLAISRYDA